MRRTVVPLWLAAAAEPRAGAFIVLFSIEAWSRTILITLVPLQAHKLLGDAQSVSFVYFIVSVSGLLSTMFVPTVVHLIRRRWAFSLGAMLMFAALAGYAAADPMIFPLALGCQVVATAFLEIVMNLFVLDHVPADGNIEVRTASFVVSGSAVYVRSILRRLAGGDDFTSGDDDRRCRICRIAARIFLVSQVNR